MQNPITHIREHKKEYLVGAGGVVIGAAGMLYFGPQVINIVDSWNINYKSPKTNEVIVELARRGHPGNMILCKETGEVFASQNRAISVLGLNRANFLKHLKGEMPSVNGYTFEKLGEMQ